jgi:hypothetical protein
MIDEIARIELPPDPCSGPTTEVRAILTKCEGCSILSVHCPLGQHAACILFEALSFNKGIPDPDLVA